MPGEEETRKKKEDERTENFLCLVFSNLLNVSGTYGVNLALDVVCKLFALLCFFFLGAVCVPYAQKATLNLPDPKLRNTTLLLEMDARVP